MDAILQMAFSNAFSCAKIIVFRYKFHWGSIDNKSALLHVMARRRQALPERKMTQFADAYLYFTQPQWVTMQFGPDGCRSPIYSSQRSSCETLAELYIEKHPQRGHPCGRIDRRTKRYVDRNVMTLSALRTLSEANELLPLDFLHKSTELCFLYWQTGRAIEQTIHTSGIWDAGALMWRHCTPSMFSVFTINTVVTINTSSGEFNLHCPYR